MSKKFLIGLTTIIILILSLTPCHRAAMEDILKFKDVISADKKYSALEELVQKCFISEEKLLVIVNEGIDEKLINNLHRSEEAAIVSIVFSKLSVEDSYSTALKNGNWFQTGKYYRDQWKSKGFLVSALSAVNLQEKLEKLKYTRWWNSAGYFLIFEETIETLASNSIIKPSGCSNAYDYLSLAWKYNILSVVFLCKEVDESLMMYSFDPFGHDSAPSPWLKAREMKGRQNHPWILFKWEKYNGIQNSSCTESEIFFDKTKSLNGYPILLNAYGSRPFVNINDNETSDISEYTGEDGLTVNVIWKTLNAKLVEVPLASEDKMLGWITDNGTVRGNLVDIVSGKVDMGMNSLTVGRLNWKTTTAYPHTTLNSCFITKDKGTIPWLIGLLYVIDNWSMIAGLTVFTIAVVTFGYIDDRRYGSGFLNALRVFISSSYVLRPSIIQQPKLIICFIFLLPLISYSTIQGKMLSLIRNPSHYGNINTEEELLQSGIKYGGPEYMKNFFISPQLIPNYRSTDTAKTCRLNLEKNEESSGCFFYCFNLFIAVSSDKSLHLASEQSVHYPNRYVARPDFPLIERFGEILRRMDEAGLLKEYRDNGFSEEISGDFFGNNNDPSSTDTAATISLEDFTYVFIGIGIGWLSAFVVFIIELIIGRSKKPNKIIIKNPEGISPGLTAESHQIIRRISRKVKWPNHF